jgi:hypothetical protein
VTNQRCSTASGFEISSLKFARELGFGIGKSISNGHRTSLDQSRSELFGFGLWLRLVERLVRELLHRPLITLFLS